jgi:hypothetical protein
MVAEAPENTERRLQARKRLDHRSLCCCIPGDEVARQRHQVRFQLVRESYVPANLLGTHEGANVEVRKLEDAKASKALDKRTSLMGW